MLEANGKERVSLLSARISNFDVWMRVCEVELKCELKCKLEDE